MITRVVLGNDTVLENVAEVQEVVQNNGDYILNGLTLNLINDENGNFPDISETWLLFSKSGVLNNIRVFKKDLLETTVDEATGEEIKVYGEQYVSLETSKYTGVQSIYNHVGSGRISVQLTSDPTKIADDKYNELLTENNNLKNQNESLTQSIAELTAIVSMLMV